MAALTLLAVLEGLIRVASIACTLTLLVSWSLFAIDETRTASNQSAAETAGREAVRQADPTPEQERDRERLHGGVREAIDDVNDVLVAPFAGITDSAKSQWVRRTVPMLLGLLVYGFGLGFLARLVRGRM
jgi:hypothetical protein